MFHRIKARVFATALGVFLFLGACTPLPVPHEERWQADHDPTAYPDSSYGARASDAGARDAGADR
jgi:hypothetical protein